MHVKPFVIVRNGGLPCLYAFSLSAVKLIKTIYVACSRYKQKRVKAYHIRFFESIYSWTAEHDGVSTAWQEEEGFFDVVRALGRAAEVAAVSVLQYFSVNKAINKSGAF